MVLSASSLLIVVLLMLAIYILWRQKFKKWRHLPSPFSPLMFVIMSAFTSNNPVLLRRLHRKYQKVTWLYLIYHNLHFQDGLCFLPLVRIPLLLVGDFNKIKCLCSNPGIKITDYKWSLFNLIRQSRAFHCAEWSCLQIHPWFSVAKAGKNIWGTEQSGRSLERAKKLHGQNIEYTWFEKLKLGRYVGSRKVLPMLGSQKG